MPIIVFQMNKDTDITYAYESVSYWNKEKKQSCVKRKLIGRVSPEIGEIVPTRKALNIEKIAIRLRHFTSFLTNQPTNGALFMRRVRRG